MPDSLRIGPNGLVEIVGEGSTRAKDGHVHVFVDDFTATTINELQADLGASKGEVIRGALAVLQISRREERASIPGILMKAVIVPGESTHEGVLVQAVAVPWLEIMEIIAKDPDVIYQIDSRKWEEIIAGAYRKQGFDVVLTPRSGDGGVDVIATLKGYGSIRILDQVKAYKPGHLVTADEVRSMLGALSADPKASKGIITTTSDFAPRIETDEHIAQFLPTRLELRPRDDLLDWLASVAKGLGG